MTVGLTPNRDVPFYWGARAKYDSKFRIDLEQVGVWYGNCDGLQKERLLAWLRTTGLTLLRKQVKQDWIGADENRLVTVMDSSSGYFIQANPKASGKYLYICIGKL